MKSRPDSAYLPSLKAWRHFRMMQVQQLARKAGRADSYISQLERRTRKASRETILKLAEALHISPEQLVNEWPQGMTPLAQENE